MRKHAAVVLALLTLSLASLGGSIARADAPALDGKWKLLVLPYGEDEFLILDVKTTDGKPTAKVVNAQPFLGEVKSAEVAAKGDDVTITVPMAQGDPIDFQGTFKDAKAFGTIRFNKARYPARLEKTDANKLAERASPPFGMKAALARAEKDPKQRVAKLLALIHEYPGQPFNELAYTPMLGAAEAAGLTPEEVRNHVETWVDASRPYGAVYIGETRSNALKALQGKKAYASLATEMAQAAEKELPADAPLDLRGNVVAMLASSARLAGRNDLAASAESRAREIDVKLDAEYHEKVPPFKPATFEGRKDKKADRAVVMEIFTGAQCPPCVAADVGFDALLTTYKPTEFIGLQYHLHIPGPDPLTNADTVGRQKYYEVNSTPTTLFNGKSAAGGGGGMSRSEVKYDEFRKEIDPALETEKQATITLTAHRAGDEIKIVAKAKAKSDDAKNAKPRLRLVLVEPAVRYVGGNKLRFHHNVVRAFPGGIEGKALEDGQGEVTTTVNLADLRKSLNTYLDEFAANSRSFPNPLPPIDFNNLAVVALVQDDADHAIWQGVLVPVSQVNP